MVRIRNKENYNEISNEMLIVMSYNQTKNKIENDYNQNILLFFDKIKDACEELGMKKLWLKGFKSQNIDVFKEYVNEIEKMDY